VNLQRTLCVWTVLAKVYDRQRPSTFRQYEAQPISCPLISVPQFEVAGSFDRWPPFSA